MDDEITLVEPVIVFGGKILHVVHHLGLGVKGPIVPPEYAILGHLRRPGRVVPLFEHTHPGVMNVNYFLLSWREFLRFRGDEDPRSEEEMQKTNNEYKTHSSSIGWPGCQLLRGILPHCG